MVGSSLIWEIPGVEESEPASWAMFLLQALTSAWLAICVHRFLLLGTGKFPERSDVSSLSRIARFTGVVLIVWLLFEGLGWIYKLAFFEVFSKHFPPRAGMTTLYAFFTFAALVILITSWLLARLSLLFPAIAIDRKFDLAGTWNQTRGNGWRLVVVTGVFPFALAILTALATRYEATLVELALLAAMSALFLIFEVAALSLSYAELTARAPPPTDPPA